MVCLRLQCILIELYVDSYFWPAKNGSDLLTCHKVGAIFAFIYVTLFIPIYIYTFHFDYSVIHDPWPISIKVYTALYLPAFLSWPTYHIIIRLVVSLLCWANLFCFLWLHLDYLWRFWCSLVVSYDCKRSVYHAVIVWYPHPYTASYVLNKRNISWQLPRISACPNFF